MTDPKGGMALTGPGFTDRLPSGLMGVTPRVQGDASGGSHKGGRWGESLAAADREPRNNRRPDS